MLNQPESALSPGQTYVYERPVLVPPQNVQAMGLPLGHIAMHWNGLRQPNVQNSKSRYLVSYSFQQQSLYFVLLAYLVSLQFIM